MENYYNKYLKYKTKYLHTLYDCDNTFKQICINTDTGFDTNIECTNNCLQNWIDNNKYNVVSTDGFHQYNGSCWNDVFQTLLCFSDVIGSYMQKLFNLSESDYDTFLLTDKSNKLYFLPINIDLDDYEIFNIESLEYMRNLKQRFYNNRYETIPTLKRKYSISYNSKCITSNFNIYNLHLSNTSHIKVTRSGGNILNSFINVCMINYYIDIPNFFINLQVFTKTTFNNLLIDKTKLLFLEISWLSLDENHGHKTGIFKSNDIYYYYDNETIDGINLYMEINLDIDNLHEEIAKLYPSNNIIITTMTIEMIYCYSFKIYNDENEYYNSLTILNYYKIYNNKRTIELLFNTNNNILINDIITDNNQNIDFMNYILRKKFKSIIDNNIKHENIKLFIDICLQYNLIDKLVELLITYPSLKLYVIDLIITNFNTELLNLLLDKNIININMILNSNLDNYNIINFLLINNKIDINSCIDKKTPLHIAIEKEDINIIELLLSYNADINKKCFVFGQSPKMLLNSKKLLIENIKIKFIDRPEILNNILIKRKLE